FIDASLAKTSRPVLRRRYRWRAGQGRCGAAIKKRCRHGASWRCARRRFAIRSLFPVGMGWNLWAAVCAATHAQFVAAARTVMGFMRLRFAAGRLSAMESWRAAFVGVVDVVGDCAQLRLGG